MATTNSRERFQAALDGLIEQVEQDRHILAAVLCGSLSHDEVYDKSDIDLVLISSDDKKMKSHSVSLVVDDVNIHASVLPRTDFKKGLEGATRQLVGAFALRKEQTTLHQRSNDRTAFRRDPAYWQP
jgi:hypothetical protein